MRFPQTPPRISPDGSSANYRNVYPNIDLKVYRNQQTFEYDWIVKPGANPATIDVAFTGTSNERIDPEGNLLLAASDGELRHAKPIAYQEIDGRRHPIQTAFHLLPNGHARYLLGPYDKTRTLIIDPSLTFASGIGGSGSSGVLLYTTFFADTASGVAVDGVGSIYIAGLTYSPDFPLVNQQALAFPTATCNPTAGCNCPPSFVAKLSPDGTKILYSTLLTSCSPSAPALAADYAGNVYVTGSIEGGSSFVQVGGGTVSPNATHAFVAKLDTNGILKSALTFGGSGADAATSIQLGVDGNLCLTGTTTSADFPVTAGAFRSSISSAQDLFLIKLNAALLAGNQTSPNALIYSTFLGPGTAPAVAVDLIGNAYVAASTTSTAWAPTAGVFQLQCWDATRTGCADAIVLKVNPAGSGLVYMTYLGGSQADTAGGIAVDGSGNAYITGITGSFDFPTTAGAYAPQFDYSLYSKTAFAVKLSPDASHLIFGTLLSSEPGLTGTAIAQDSSGNLWVGGVAAQPVLPVKNGIEQTLFNAICTQHTPDGSPTSTNYCAQAGYLAQLNPTGTSLTWATYLGGGAGPALNAIALDSSGNLLAAGFNIAVRNTAASPAKTNSAGVVKISPTGTSLSNVAVQIAAGFQAGLPEPGGIGTLYFTSAPSSQSSPVNILVDGVAAPLIPSPSGIYTLPNNAFQANFQVPVGLGQPQAHIVEVDFNGQSAFIVPQQTAPGIFTLPSGAGAIQHAADYSLVTIQNPVVRGETLMIYATGLGRVSNPVPTGIAATGPDPILPSYCNSVTTNAGTVLYAGLTPGIPGLYQVNVQVSNSLPPGTNYFYLQSDGCWFFHPPQTVYQSNAVGVYVP